MKRVLGIIVLAIVLGWTFSVSAKEFNMNLPSGPMIKGGTSTFVVTPAPGGSSGVTVIDRPHEYGTTWTVQVDTSSTSGISPYTAGQSGTTDYSGVGYQITLYFSDYITGTQTGGSPYQLPPVSWSGSTPYMHTITVPPCKYMWGRVTESGGVSPIFRLPVKLQTLEP